MTDSSVFAPAAVPQTNPTSYKMTESTVFAAADEAPRGNYRTAVTKSSIEGGIFSSNSAYAQADLDSAPRSARGPKPEIDANRVAGQATAAPEKFSLSYGAPLANSTNQANNSFRSNPNKPSQVGGIFGAPPPPNKAAIARGNPNASSIPGGIFG